MRQIPDLRSKAPLKLLRVALIISCYLISLPLSTSSGGSCLLWVWNNLFCIQVLNENNVTAHIIIEHKSNVQWPNWNSVLGHELVIFFLLFIP